MPLHDLVSPPPLPFDQFPPVVRLVGRRLLSELWRSCFDAGLEAGLAAGRLEGLAVGVLGTLGFVVLALVIALVTQHAARTRP